MNINTNQIVPISEANQNFSRVARVGLAVAAGEMGYEELLTWIHENK